MIIPLANGIFDGKLNIESFFKFKQKNKFQPLPLDVMDVGTK